MKGGTELLDQLPGEDAVQRNVPLVCVRALYLHLVESHVWQSPTSHHWQNFAF